MINFRHDNFHRPRSPQYRLRYVVIMEHRIWLPQGWFCPIMDVELDKKKKKRTAPHVGALFFQSRKVKSDQFRSITCHW